MQCSRSCNLAGIPCLLKVLTTTYLYTLQTDDSSVWNGALYIDTGLPFGLRSAPKIFSAVEWITLHEGVTILLHYLDHFLMMGRKHTSECWNNLEKLVQLCQQLRLGSLLKWQKLEGPSMIFVFLGILLDTRKLEMHLPEEKWIE